MGLAVLGWGRSGWAGQLGGLVGEVAGSVGAGVSTGVVVRGLRGVRIDESGRAEGGL